MGYETINKIASEIGTTRQNLAKMLKRHAAEAPKPDENGRYDLEEVRKFYNYRTYTPEKGEAIKLKSLEQEYRLKKAKADEYEAQFMSREDAYLIVKMGILIIEDCLSRFMDDLNLTEEQRAELKRECKIQFKRFYDFRDNLAPKKGRVE